MRLRIGGDIDFKLVPTFNSRNKGLRYIKHLDLACANDSRRPQLDMTFSLIVENIPHDNLLSFRWNTWNNTSVDNICRLLYSQKADLGICDASPPSVAHNGIANAPRD